MKIATLAALVLTLAVVGCGDDGGSSDKTGVLPSGEFSVCVFAYGDPGQDPQVLVGPCSITPKNSVDERLQIAYLDKDGATISFLAHAFWNQAETRELIADSSRASALRVRLREVNAECKRNPSGDCPPKIPQG